MSEGDLFPFEFSFAEELKRNRNYVLQLGDEVFFEKIEKEKLKIKLNDPLMDHLNSLFLNDNIGNQVEISDNKIIIEIDPSP